MKMATIATPTQNQKAAIPIISSFMTGAYHG
jgi:hypothetical protein